LWHEGVENDRRQRVIPHGETVAAAFAPVPDRAAYVPREATEAALAAIVRRLDAGERVIVLRGPAGMGKSLLLRVLPERLGSGYHALRLPTGALPLPDLIALALGLRGAAASRDPARALLAEARRAEAEGSALVIVVDDARTLGASVAQALAELAREAGGALRFVLAVGDRPTDALESGFGAFLPEVRLESPMSEDEVARYLAARLERAGVAGEVRRRFEGAAQVARLRALSGGVPALLNRLAVEIGSAPLADAPADAAASEARAGRAALAALPRSLPRDPFGPGAGAAPYQPRSTSEALLARVQRELEAGRHAVRLRGPAGIGKTTLLRVLETRLRDPFQPVFLPYPRLAPDEFWSFVLHQLGAPPGDAPERQLVEAARRLARVRGTLVLLVDDATSLPAESATRLAALVEEAEGALRVVMTADDEADASGLPRIGDGVEIRVEERLAPAETEAYLLGRLMHFGAPAAVRRRFDARTISALHRASGGLPRELNRLAGEIERESLTPAATRAPAAGEAAPSAPAGAASDAAADPAGATIQVPWSPTAPPRRAPPRPAPARNADWLRGALALLPHIGLGLGIPLALLALWLWLAPLFAR
jgi:type II secretory pathway predicted ATPase ExeA